MVTVSHSILFESVQIYSTITYCIFVLARSYSNVLVFGIASPASQCVSRICAEASVGVCVEVRAKAPLMEPSGGALVFSSSKAIYL